MHPHRSNALGYASAASAAHSRAYGACAAEAAASESSGLSVGGCIRARRYFGPHPVLPGKKTQLRRSQIRTSLLWPSGSELRNTDRVNIISNIVTVNYIRKKAPHPYAYLTNYPRGTRL